MKKIWKQILASVLTGVLLPRMLLLGGSRIGPEAASQPSSGPAQSDTEPAEKVSGKSISVLTGENTVTVMELEDYVLGVVLAEMPAAFEEEALKAQAVVARTYALRRLQSGDRHTEAAICTDSSCCQAYITQAQYLQERGDREDLAKAAEAANQTEGQVLTYDGALIEATYFSCSGGRTEDAVAVWGAQIPYLQSVDSPGEEHAKAYWERVLFTPAEFAAALGREMTGSPASWLGKCTYTEGGGVASMMIGGICYSGTQLRKLLGLNSTAFFMTADSDGITVETLGKGHRVGMSQYGADAMAVAGSSYEQILLHYYQGTRIDKISDIG